MQKKSSEKTQKKEIILHLKKIPFIYIRNLIL